MIKDNSLDSFRGKVSKNYEMITAAYHEAGHALFALLKYCYVNNVKIFYDSEYLGVTIFYSFLKEVKDSELKVFFATSEVGVNYAGLISERILYKKISGLDKYPSFLKDGSYRDTKVAAKIVNKYNLARAGKPRALLKKRIQKQITDILQEHWGDVELLSHFLIQNKKITFDQIKKLLTKKSEHRDFWREKFYVINFLIRDDGYARPEATIKATLRAQKENI